MMNDQLNEAVEVVVNQPDHVNEPASEIIESADLRRNASNNKPEIPNSLSCALDAEKHDAIQVVSNPPKAMNVSIPSKLANTGAIPIRQRANCRAANTTFLTILVATLVIASVIAYYVSQRQLYMERFPPTGRRLPRQVRVRYNGATWTIPREVYDAWLEAETQEEREATALFQLVVQQALHNIAYDINRPEAPPIQVPSTPMHEIRNAEVKQMTEKDFREIFSDLQSEYDPLDSVLWADWLEGNRGEDNDPIREDNPIVVRVCGKDAHWMKEEGYKKWIYGKRAHHSHPLPDCGLCPYCRASKQEEFYEIVGERQQAEDQ